MTGQALVTWAGLRRRLSIAAHPARVSGPPGVPSARRLRSARRAVQDNVTGRPTVHPCANRVTYWFDNATL